MGPPEKTGSLFWIKPVGEKSREPVPERSLQVGTNGIQLFCKAKVLGAPGFKSSAKKNLVDRVVSWFKVLRAISMNPKFPYILRISEKAKHVRFQVSAEKGLEIVVPKRFNASRVPSLVEKNSQWIERAFQKGEGLPRADQPDGGLADTGRDYIACARPDMEGACLS